MKITEHSYSVLETQFPRKALIMAGGFGSRMKELTKEIPKPMLPLKGRPIMDYNIELFRNSGIRDIAISIFYHGDKIKKYYGNGRDFGLNISYVEEKEPLGTAGALSFCKDWFDGPFVMCNADELKDIDLTLMFRQHLDTGALATIALTEVENPSQYGVVGLDDKKILRFVEKPKKEEAPSNFINAGLYIINPEVVSMIPQRYCMLEKEVFPALAAEGKLYGLKFEGQWFDTGTPQRYALAEKMWKGFSKK